MAAARSTSQNIYWSGVLAVTAVLGSYALACVFPFAALAALAAVTLPRRQGVVLVAAAFGVNQVVGFSLLDYAQGDHALLWGAVIGAAAFLALGAARLAYGSETRAVSVRSVSALAAAIAAYQVVMFVGAFALDGFASSTPEIVATVARNDVLWFAGLLALNLALTSALPRWFGSTKILRTA